MTQEQKKQLEELVKTNEMFKGYRVVIDYAIQLACVDSPYGLNQEMTDYVEELYKSTYDH